MTSKLFHVRTLIDILEGKNAKKKKKYKSQLTLYKVFILENKGGKLEKLNPSVFTYMFTNLSLRKTSVINTHKVVNTGHCMHLGHFCIVLVPLLQKVYITSLIIIFVDLNKDVN